MSQGILAYRPGDALSAASWDEFRLSLVFF
jgi:hypothetical protein